MMFIRRRISYFYGLFAEYYVATYLFFCGYQLLKHRFKTKYGEIDLIFKNKNNIVAVEVKARHDKNIRIGEVVSYRQLERIADALKFFIAKHQSYRVLNIRIDIILVKGFFFLKHLKNVFEYEDLS